MTVPWHEGKLVLPPAVDGKYDGLCIYTQAHLKQPECFTHIPHETRDGLS